MYIHCIFPVITGYFWVCIHRGLLQVDTQFSMEQSDLFESEVHLAEIGDIMAIAVEGTHTTQCTYINPLLTPELPSLLGVVSVAEALLRLPSGTHLLTCLVANMPDQLDHGNIQQNPSNLDTFGP